MGRSLPPYSTGFSGFFFFSTPRPSRRDSPFPRKAARRLQMVLRFAPGPMLAPGLMVERGFFSPPQTPEEAAARVGWASPPERNSSYPFVVDRISFDCWLRRGPFLGPFFELLKKTLAPFWSPGPRIGQRKTAVGSFRHHGKAPSGKRCGI